MGEIKTKEKKKQKQSGTTSGNNRKLYQWKSLEFVNYGGNKTTLLIIISLEILQFPYGDYSNRNLKRVWKLATVIVQENSPKEFW